MTLSSSTALVTGGAVRIGRAICLALADKGCNIVIHYNDSVGAARSLQEEIAAKGLKAWTVSGDLTSEDACEKIIEDSFSQAGQVDFLINNAAVFHKDSIETATAEKFKTELNVNFMAPVRLTRCFVSRVSDTGGKVINLLDRRIVGVDPKCVPYQLSKKMLAEFTKSAALEFAPSITVNGVAPGAILPPPGPEAGKVFDLAGNIPMSKGGTPEDVAGAVVFLLESNSITGQIIFVDGGQHLT